MRVEKTDLAKLLVIWPDVYRDDRGYFFEIFSKTKFRESGIPSVSFVQGNQSGSHKNVLRGLHFQKPPYAQGKMVGVAQGRVMDVVVDLRRNFLHLGSIIWKN